METSLQDIVIELRPGDQIQGTKWAATDSEHRNSARRRYPQQDPTGVPTPVILQWQLDCLNAVVSNDLPLFKTLLKSALNKQTNSVVHIRGLNQTITDLSLIDDELETLMWNPFHFAVYLDRLSFVKFIVSMQVNLGLTLQKTPAESELDPTNSTSFAEDKIMVLLVAVQKGHIQILKYLLDDLSQYWTHKNFNYLVEKLPKGGSTLDSQIREVVFASRTAHCFVESMSLKKRSQWLLEHFRQLVSNDLHCFLTPFVEKPYVSTLINYLMFEEFSMNTSLIESCLNNMTDADYLKIIYLMPESQTDIPPIDLQPQIQTSFQPNAASIQSQSVLRGSIPLDDASVVQSRNSFSQDDLSQSLNQSLPSQVEFEIARKAKGGLAAYFDKNRMMKLEENFEPEVVPLFQRFIDRLVDTQSQHRESRRQFWQARADLVKAVDVDRFADIAEQLRFTYEVDVYRSLLNYYDRFDNNTVSLDKVSRVSVGARASDVTKTPSRKWTPLTHAIHSENKDLVDHILKHNQGPLKKLLQVPELSKQSALNKLFPYRPIFLFTFYESIWITPKEEQLNLLLRMGELESKDLVRLVDCATTQQLFSSMSVQYRYSFIESLLSLRPQMLRELEIAKKQHVSPFKPADAGASALSDPEDLFFDERRAQIESMFLDLYAHMSQPLYALYFYQTFCKEIAKRPTKDPKWAKVLDNCLNEISSNDIELFLYYSLDTAQSLVKTLEQKGQDMTDMYLRKLALKVQKHPHYSLYAAF